MSNLYPTNDKNNRDGIEYSYIMPGKPGIQKIKARNVTEARRVIRANMNGFRSVEDKLPRGFEIWRSED